MTNTKRLTLTGILAALGVILNLLEITYFIPYLNLDFSEVVILVAVVLLGIKAACFTAFLKSLISLLVKGPVGPLAIGQITAFIASMIIALSFDLFYKKLKWKLLPSLIGMVIVFTLTMTLFNYLFITPIYFGFPFYTSFIKQFEPSMLNMNDPLKWFSFLSPYARTIIIVYLPFNLLKGSLIAIAFRILVSLEPTIKKTI